MSKLKCDCGHIIVDQTDNLPYKGYILADSKVEELTSALKVIDTLIQAIQEGRKEAWIKEHFSSGYPMDLSASSMIHDLLLSATADTTQHIYECENCGRILIQRGATNKFNSYTPETDNSKGILMGRHKE